MNCGLDNITISILGFLILIIILWLYIEHLFHRKCMLRYLGQMDLVSASCFQTVHTRETEAMPRSYKEAMPCTLSAPGNIIYQAVFLANQLVWKEKRPEVKTYTD